MAAEKPPDAWLDEWLAKQREDDSLDALAEQAEAVERVLADTGVGDEAQRRLVEEWAQRQAEVVDALFERLAREDGAPW